MWRKQSVLKGDTENPPRLRRNSSPDILPSDTHVHSKYTDV